MLKQIRHIILGILLASLALPTGSALAALGPQQVQQPGKQQENPVKSQIDIQPIWLGQISKSANRIDMQYAQRKRISASQAKSAAMSRIRGAKFINVQLVNQSTYRVRLQQQNGRIVDVYVDAYTGRVKG